MSNAHRDENRITTMLGVDSATFTIPTEVAVNPSTHQMLVDAAMSISGDPLPILGATTAIATAIVDSSGNQISSFGGGVEYQNGDTGSTTNTGKVIIFDSDPLDTHLMVDVSQNNPLPVSVSDAVTVTISSGTVQAEGSVAVDDSITNINPLTVSGRASTATPAPVDADDDNQAIWLTRSGSVHTVLDSGTVSIDQTTPGTTNKVSLSDETTKVIGTVNQGTSPWVTSNATTSVVGNGAAATAQRVTIANDSTGTVAATLSAETTKVIGTIRVASGGIASGSLASGSIASGAFASGAVSSGAIASGALAAGSIAVGAITAGDNSIATTEDTARASGEHLVKIGASRLDTPVANANVSNDGDYTNLTVDNFGKLWTAGTAQEDVAHVAGEAVKANGVRRIDTAATSAASSGDWATMDQSAEGALWATLTPTTTSGCSLFRSIDLDETEEDVKTSAGNLYGYYFANTNAAARYLKLYNATAANTTVGTTTPIATFYMPPTSAGHVGLPYPISFSTALCAAATTGVADNDTGAPGANDVLFMAWYK